MIDSRIGLRVKALREARKESQADLARALNFRDRQTVGHIEAGIRKLSAKELIALITHYAVPLEHFTNPFMLTGNERFSWRQRDVSKEDLVTFQARAGEWIGAYRELSRLAGDRLPSLMARLGLTYTSSFEEAEAAGEAVSAELALGDVPARHLASVMEERLGILVLMVDAIPGVSGAACTLPELNAALINRHEPAPRRNFDLAHELFHLLTWDTMPPQWMDGEPSANGASHSRKRVERVEQLANKFAAGLLMPGSALDKLGTPHGDLVAWIKAASVQLGVSSSALKWQLVNSKRGPSELAAVPDEAFRENRSRSLDVPPPRFSRRFIQQLATGIERGHISARKAASLTDVTLDELGKLCDVFDVKRPTTLAWDSVASA